MFKIDFIMFQKRNMPENGVKISFESRISRRFLGLKESAIYLGISVSAMQKISSQRLLPKYQPAGKVYFLIDDLDNYILSGRKKSRFEIEAEEMASLSKALPHHLSK